MLRSIMIPKAARAYERMVKLGDPATKIVEMAEKLNVDRLVMGGKDLVIVNNWDMSAVRC